MRNPHHGFRIRVVHTLLASARLAFPTFLSAAFLAAFAGSLATFATGFGGALRIVLDVAAALRTFAAAFRLIHDCLRLLTYARDGA